MHVYVDLAMFSIGVHLFKPSDFSFFNSPARGRSFFDLMLGAESIRAEGVTMHNEFYVSIIVRVTSDTTMGMGMLWKDFPTCNRQLRVLQRAIRRFHRTKMANRRLAVGMALHPRLGGCSPLACIGHDMLIAVIQAFPAI